MELRGKTIDFKISNKVHAGRYEKALKDMARKEQEIKAMDQTKLTDVLDAVITMLRDFLLTVTGEDVLQGCEDAEEAQDTYFEFLEEVKKQKNTFLKPFSIERVK